MNPPAPKVFGIGLSKTGTTSLDNALNMLAIRSIHFPSDPVTFAELSEGRYELTVLKSFQAATDISVSPFYPQLDQIYPNSKFILTVRDIDQWLDSVREHWEFIWRWAPHNRPFRKFLEFITAAVFGVHRFHRDRFVYVYRRHLADVQNYFVHRPDDLLTLDICAGEGWTKLCSFLGVPVPEQEFPLANRREEKIGRGDWIEVLEQAVQDFQTIVPDHQHYVLVDEELLAGSMLDVPGRARRPMERDGICYGPPADSDTAIREIERLRTEGIPYLVITWPAFWWLTCYGDLARHLKTHFQLLLENERLLVMDLRSPPGGDRNG